MNDIPITIHNAEENNLKSVSLEIPRNKLVCVTGVSGSGKSSLIFDVLEAEGRRRYLETFSGAARLALGKLRRPEVAAVTGLSPTIAIGQKTITRNPRSTVGTMTGIYDLLRLLFARMASSQSSSVKPSRSLFSFNSDKGACPNCKGIGLEERIDPELFIGDASKTLREGAIVMTTPSGYIVYSQVTMDVLNLVCQAEGFNVDIPWQDLTNDQKSIVLYGSNKIKVPFGKHTLESRMKWSGIVAKPREEGYYKGIVPIMEEILKRDRNANILRFVESVQCSSCGGDRLNQDALSFTIDGKTIADLATLTLEDLMDWFVAHNEIHDNPVGAEVFKAFEKRYSILNNLGLSYLTLSRKATTLSGGESQRIRLATRVLSGLQGVIYVIDEPSVGLQFSEHRKLMTILKQLRDQGNTVIVIEHDEDTMLQSDWLIDVGPRAGVNGGEIRYNGSVKKSWNDHELKNSLTLQMLQQAIPVSRNKVDAVKNPQWLSVCGASQHNLNHIDVHFLLSGLNVITGVSGSGKNTLINGILAAALRQQLNSSRVKPGEYVSISGLEKIKKLVFVDQSPIGRTPRSNPATYTGLSDKIRDLFAATSESKSRGWKKGRFSFNNTGGRCETCQGAGVTQIGMHFLGDVDVVCETCGGKRFNDETLEILWHGKNISDILDLSIDEAINFFTDEPALLRYLSTMQNLGLGYITLGQPATTLSGGEAQRIKLATELVKQSKGDTLYILNEPTTGLHTLDVEVLIQALDKLVQAGNTILVSEHHPLVIRSCDWLVELGPGNGKHGGKVTWMNTPDGYEMADNLTEDLAYKKPVIEDHIRLRGVTTNNLNSVDVDIPHGEITVITGLSGSGKSSLAFDTLFAEGQRRYAENFTTWARTKMNLPDAPPMESATGLTPAIAISQSGFTGNPRSTVGTMTELYDILRLAFSRASTDSSGATAYTLSSLFSFNHQSGACPACNGIGSMRTADPEKFVIHPEKSLLNGALDGSKTGKFYGDPYGQYVSTLKAVGELMSFDFSVPYNALSQQAKEIAMYGTGEQQYEVQWNYKRKDRTGTLEFKGPWKGFVFYIDDEYNRKHNDKRGDTIRPLMKDVPCPQCHGARLSDKVLQYSLGGMNIYQMGELSISQFQSWWLNADEYLDAVALQIVDEIRKDLIHRCDMIIKLGLGYLSINRSSGSLSGGEAQRLRLATQLGAQLTGVTYVLDEPTIGLHQRNTEDLLNVLRQLANNGNTVVVVEHDRSIMETADYIIDLGPGAGALGGDIVAAGTLDEIKACEKSLTGKYLNAKTDGAVSQLIPLQNPGAGLTISGAKAHNLKNISLEIPAGIMTVITGVSGSGKSSLMRDVIMASFDAGSATACSSITGFENFSGVVSVGQQMITGHTHSTVLSWLGIWDKIRSLLAATPEAMTQGLKKGDFSLVSGKGRCETCKGTGKLSVAMDFLSDVSKPCPECKGLRFKAPVLEVKYNGASVADILNRDISGLRTLFSETPGVSEALLRLEEAGLGYLKAGQSLSTMSGGELQRLKLVKHLADNHADNQLFLLDEPTTGLHFMDVERLLQLFGKMIRRGNTLLVIEHNEMVVQAAAKVIELGPGGGEDGGEIVFLR